MTDRSVQLDTREWLERHNKAPTSVGTDHTCGFCGKAWTRELQEW